MSGAPETEPAEDPPKKKGAPIVLIGAILLACGAGGAGAYFLAPAGLVGQPAEHQGAIETQAAGASHPPKSKGDKTDAHAKEADPTDDGDASPTSRFAIVGDRGIFTPADLVVSIRPVGRVRHLKLSIVIETSPDSGDLFLTREPRIRDALNTYLRAVDVSALEDPLGMDRIRAQIKRRIEFVAAPAPVDAVLITDFILN